MAITYVGNATWTEAIEWAWMVIDISWLSPSVGDIILVYVWYSSKNYSASMVTAWYTWLGINAVEDDSKDLSVYGFYKLYSGVWDNSVSIATTTWGANFRAAWLVSVFRWVDSTQPLDVTPTVWSSRNTWIPNPPAITPITDWSMIVAIWSQSSAATNGNLVQPSWYTYAWAIEYDPWNVVKLAMWYKLRWWWTEDPWIFTNYRDSSSFCAAAWTVALRPWSNRRIFIT